MASLPLTRGEANIFYRPGGSDTRINVQYDEVYSDQVEGATGWLPINKGDTISVNISRALLDFNNSASSTVKKTPQAAEYQIVMEMKTIGGQTNDEAWPIDQWQNLVVSSSRRAHRAGFARLRILNINNLDGTGVAMAMQVSRTGDAGAST